MSGSTRRFREGAALAAMLVLFACDHGKLDVPAAGPDEIARGAGEAGGAGADGGGAGAMPGMRGAGGMPGGMSGTLPGAAAGSTGPGAPAGTVPAGSTAGEALSGVITVAADLAGKVPPGAFIFVIARPVGMDKGPPLATTRLPADRFPIEFRLGPENVMMQGMPFQGQVNLSARLDTDGNAMSKGPGDILGTLPGPVTVGASDIRIELNQPL